MAEAVPTSGTGDGVTRADLMVRPAEMSGAPVGRSNHEDV
jgi:hypothetical protein